NLVHFCYRQRPRTGYKLYTSTEQVTMVNCFVRGCPHKGGQKHLYPDVALHPFPNNIHRIRQWLQQTGQPFENFEETVAKIHKGAKASIHRMCSTHFTADQFRMKGSKRVLKQNAIPIIFPGTLLLMRNIPQINVTSPQLIVTSTAVP
ncbi:hypothetical protein GDO86_006726, partial [Hymenochirus boettgeri]